MRRQQHARRFIAGDGVRYAPRTLRWSESVIAAVSCATVGFIALPNIPAPWSIASFVVLLGALAWSVNRGWRLGLRVTSDSICIDNYWRSYRFPWTDVADVGVGLETMGATAQPAFLFRLRTGRIIRAQATPQKVEPRRKLFDQLAGLAPCDVKVWPSF